MLAVVPSAASIAGELASFGKHLLASTPQADRAGMADEAGKQLAPQLQPQLEQLNLSSCKLNDALGPCGWLQVFVLQCRLLKRLVLDNAELTGDVDEELFRALLALDGHDAVGLQDGSCRGRCSATSRFHRDRSVDRTVDRSVDRTIDDYLYGQSDN